MNYSNRIPESSLKNSAPKTQYNQIATKIFNAPAKLSQEKKPCETVVFNSGDKNGKNCNFSKKEFHLKIPFFVQYHVLFSFLLQNALISLDSA